jgi:hypothetical protein
VRCGKASYFSRSDGYGPFKYGSVCVFDDDLKAHFEPRTGAEIDVQNMARQIDRQQDELMKARDKIARLEARLVDVGV